MSFIVSMAELRKAVRIDREDRDAALRRIRPYAPGVPLHLNRCDVHDVGWAGDGPCWADGADGVHCIPAAQGPAGDEDETTGEGGT